MRRGMDYLTIKIHICDEKAADARVGSLHVFTGLAISDCSGDLIRDTSYVLQKEYGKDKR
mgnify:CR=1 FL=1